MSIDHSVKPKTVTEALGRIRAHNSAIPVDWVDDIKLEPGLEQKKARLDRLTTISWCFVAGIGLGLLGLLIVVADDLTDFWAYAMIGFVVFCYLAVCILKWFGARPFGSGRMGH